MFGSYQNRPGCSTFNIYRVILLLNAAVLLFYVMVKVIEFLKIGLVVPHLILMFKVFWKKVANNFPVVFNNNIFFWYFGRCEQILGAKLSTQPSSTPLWTRAVLKIAILLYISGNGATHFRECWAFWALKVQCRSCLKVPVCRSFT